MIRTQVYLDEKQYEDVKFRARLRKKPVAEIIRELLDVGLAARQVQDVEGGLMSIANLGITGGPKDMAANLDEYLYGAK